METQNEIKTRRRVCEGESFLDFKRRAKTESFHEDFANYTKSYGDVYYWPQGGFHVVTDIALAKEVLTTSIYSANRASFFISRMPHLDISIIKDFFAVVGRMMVMSDEREHQRRRNAGSQGINEKLLNLYRPKIEAVVAKLLQPLKDDGSIEFVEGVARQLPQTVLADLFCIPESDRDLFNRCSNIMTGFFGGAVEYTNEVGKEVNEAAIAISQYFRGLIDERRENPQDDFFSGMLAVQEEFELDDEDIISQAVMMLVAGQVTTTDQICNNMYLMLKTQGVYQRLQENKGLLATTTEEFKRLDPAVTFLFRVATKDTTLGDQSIAAGETIFIANHAVNRDVSEFKQPEEVNIERKGMKHFAYGHGPHYCMGARLGRLQMSILFGKMLEMFPQLSFDSENLPERDHYSLSFSGFKKIPIIVS